MKNVEVEAGQGFEWEERVLRRDGESGAPMDRGQDYLVRRGPGGGKGELSLGDIILL